jgi:hypothetical protein
MIKVPILAVLDGCKGLLLELEVDGKKEGNGDLFLDSKLTLDDASRKALKAAFCMLHPEQTDLFVRVAGEKDFCLCGGSLPFPSIWECTPAFKGWPGNRGHIAQDASMKRVR